MNFNITMSTNEQERRNAGPLEWLLAVSVLALAMQMSGDPAKLVAWIFGTLDVRTWTYGTWLTGTAVILFVLIGLRYGPELKVAYAERSERLAMQKKKAAEDAKRIADKRHAEEVRKRRKEIFPNT
jgi:hypothetical protein